MTTPPGLRAAEKLKVSVLGAGSLGKEHARIYAELAAANRVDFVGVYDLAAETARKVAEKHRVRAFHSLAEAVTDSEAVLTAAVPLPSSVCVVPICEVPGHEVPPS